MHPLAKAVVRPFSALLQASGAAVLLVQSIQEHWDLLATLLGIALLFIGKLLWDWKTDQDKKTKELEQRVAALEANKPLWDKLSEDVAQHLKDEARFQRDFYRFQRTVIERLAALHPAVPARKLLAEVVDPKDTIDAELVAEEEAEEA